MTKTFTFHPLHDFNEFKLEYKREIRVVIEWDRIKRAKVGQLFANEKTRMFVPRYTGGDWMDGKPIAVAPGKADAFIRVPAVKIGEHFLLLDGYHRITELGPKWVIVDYIEPEHRYRKYFIDLYNPYL